MRHWLPEPRILNVLIRSGISIGPEDVRPYPPLWRLELRKQLQGKPTSDGKPLTREEADSCIDKALASGALDSDGFSPSVSRGHASKLSSKFWKSASCGTSR